MIRPLKLVGASLLLAAVGLACSSSSNGGTPGTDAGPGDSGNNFDANRTDSGGNHDSGPPAEGGGGEGGDGGAGNHSFATAAPIMVGAMTPTMGTLPDPTTSKDYYSFTGMKGEAIGIFTTAKTGTNPFDPTYLDLVATLYDSTQTQIAQDDDPWPRFTNDPTLFTILPADGTYYIVIDECNAAFGPMGCSAASMITHFNYTVQVGNIGGPSVTKEAAEPANDTPAGAATVAYNKPSGQMGYSISLLYGLFQSGTDKDYFSFTVPADSTVPATARARADFWVITSGINDGDGSTASPGNVYVIDPMDATGAHLSQLDDTLYGTGDSATSGPADLSVPVQLNKQYYFVVEHSSQAAGANDFYFVQHFGGSIYLNPPQVETEGATGTGMNDTAATAQPLTSINNMDMTYSFEVDGNLPTPMDVDWYTMTLPAGVTKISGNCVGQRAGSGVSGLTYQYLKSDGTTSIAMQTESASMDLQIGGTTPVAIPAGSTSVLLKVIDNAQTAMVTDTSYVCNVLVSP